jgi:hypothetical protein
MKSKEMETSNTLNVPLIIQNAIVLMMQSNPSLRNMQVEMVNINEGDAVLPEHWAMNIVIEHQMPGCAPMRRVERFNPLEKDSTQMAVLNAFTELLIGIGVGQYIKEKIAGYIENPLHKI